MLTQAKVGGNYYSQDTEGGDTFGATYYRETWYTGPTNSYFINNYLKWIESKVVIPSPLGDMVKLGSCSRYIVGADQKVICIFHYSIRSMYGMQIRSFNDVGSRAYNRALDHTGIDHGKVRHGTLVIGGVTSNSKVIDYPVIDVIWKVSCTNILHQGPYG